MRKNVRIMSNQLLNTILTVSKSVCKNQNFLARPLSRRANNVESPYKVIKSRKASRDEGNLVWRDPNFEILASPSGFPFFLPGNISPAWYDKHTTINQSNCTFVMEQIEDANAADGNIICLAQECPLVLRQTICDLFPNNDLDVSELSLVTITLKPDIKLFRRNNELETEKLAQTFVLTANSICDKLRKAGYWADFINPFSGKPYLVPVTPPLHETDDKLHCLDFQISEFNECKVIAREENRAKKKKFVGSLFTNAPSNKYLLNNIFST